MLGTSLMVQWLRICLPGYTPIQHKNIFFFKKKRSGEFIKEEKKKKKRIHPGFQCGGWGFDPWSGNEDPGHRYEDPASQK